ncbi:hypothetical protein [Streptomyces globisporus]|uniref:hypothetical protein n=1 Tax=Streptomyces globisporus TaxID=1908 RepID=UPI003990C1CA
MSTAQIKAAEARWPDSKLELHQTDATRFLAETEEQFHGVFSVFGAAWFTASGQLGMHWN